MSAVLLEGPAAEPLSLAQAKAFLRIEHADDDAVITTLIAAARAHVETCARHCLASQVWRVFFARVPADGRLHLPFAPAREVVAARTRDGAGVTQDLDAAGFAIDEGALPGIVSAGASGGGGRLELDVRFGYEAPANIPGPLLHAVRLLLSHWYENRSVTAAPNDTWHSPEGFHSLIAPYRGLRL